MGKYLTHDEEKELISLWQEKACLKSRDRVVMAYQPLVNRVLRKLKVPANLHEDLQQDAVFGILKALQKFDVSRDVRFGTYAMWWIRSEVQDAMSLRGNLAAGMTGSVRRIHTMSSRAHFLAAGRLRDAGNPESPDNILREMADIIGVTPEKLQDHQAALRTISLQTTISTPEGDVGELIDLIPCDATRTGEDEVISHQSAGVTQTHIEDMLARLTRREAAIIRSRIYTDEKAVPLRALGDKYGLSSERIRQIESRALGKLSRMAQSQNLQHLLQDATH